MTITHIVPKNWRTKPNASITCPKSRMLVAPIASKPIVQIPARIFQFSEFVPKSPLSAPAPIPISRITAPTVVEPVHPVIEAAPAPSEAKAEVKAKKRKKWGKAGKFHRSQEWKALRLEALALHGSVCQRCGSTDAIQVDHIKPKSIYPELSLSLSNLQILCWPCNRRKWTDKDETDYRKPLIHKVMHP